MAPIVATVPRILAALAALILVLAAARGAAHAAATCADFPNQAAAQQAANTADADHDGVYCESLPCPCLRPGQSSPAPGADATSCETTDRVVTVAISKTRYPAVLAHIRQAVRADWPRVLTIHRAGADRRRDRALAAIPTRPGMDRDEWPMAFARRSWPAHVAYVPSAQNRGAGSSIALKLRRYCDGTRFRVIAY